MDGRDAAVSAAGAPGAVYAAFRTVALDRPGATAVIGPDGSETTYATLLGAVEDAAGRLTAGLAPGRSSASRPRTRWPSSPSTWPPPS